MTLRKKLGKPMKKFCRDCEQFKDGMGKYSKYCKDCRSSRSIKGLAKRKITLNEKK